MGENGLLHACLLACLVDCISRNSLWRNVDFIRRSKAPFADKKLTSRYNAEILLFLWISTCN